MQASLVFYVGMNETKPRKDGLDMEDGQTLSYRGCTIVRYENDFDHGFDVLDQQGRKVSDLPTLRKAKNVIDKIAAV